MAKIRDRKRIGIALVAGLVLTLALSPLMAGTKEGGYVYNGESRFVDNVYNFVKHFTYEQYYYAETWQFNSANNTYVDGMDLAYYSGHGNYWYIGMRSGVGVSLPSGCPWGDYELEFIIFQSCQVIPSIPEMNAGKISNWWSNWAGAGRPFQGLHQAIGYRTLSYSGNGISNNFGGRVRNNQAMWQAWFAAVNDERSWWKGADYPGFASVVMYPGLDNDTYYTFGADPPAGHTNLRTYYQY
jgi:hypothetical protein